jgi:hypothetical protein
MKHANTLLTILAVLVLLGVGYYLLQEKKEANYEPEKTYTEIVENIDGETQEIELDHPLTESFSNSKSNTETSRVSAETPSNDSELGTASKNVFNKVIKTITKPFTLGFYYLDTINKHGIDKCIAGKTDSDDDEDFPEYNEDNFKLKEISFVGNTVYLQVDADDIPKKACATIVQFKDFKTNLYDAVHVVVRKTD